MRTANEILCPTAPGLPPAELRELADDVASSSAATASRPREVRELLLIVQAELGR